MSKAKRSIVILAFALVGLFLLLFFTRFRFVLLAIGDSGSVNKEPYWTILHPFRNRNPEHTADAFLEKIREGDFKRAFSTLDWTDKSKTETITRESEYHLISWRLINIEETHENLRLYYLVSRSPDTEGNAPVWVTVNKTNTGWQVIQYEAWY